MQKACCLGLRRRAEIHPIRRSQIFPVRGEDGIIIFPTLGSDELHACGNTDHNFVREEGSDSSVHASIVRRKNLFFSQKESNVAADRSLQIAILDAGKLHNRNACTLVRQSMDHHLRRSNMRQESAEQIAAEDSEPEQARKRECRGEFVSSQRFVMLTQAIIKWYVVCGM